MTYIIPKELASTKVAQSVAKYVVAVKSDPLSVTVSAQPRKSKTVMNESAATNWASSRDNTKVNMV